MSPSDSSPSTIGLVASQYDGHQDYAIHALEWQEAKKKDGREERDLLRPQVIECRLSLPHHDWSVLLSAALELRRGGTAVKDCNNTRSALGTRLCLFSANDSNRLNVPRRLQLLSPFDMLPKQSNNVRLSGVKTVANERPKTIHFS